MLLPTDDPELFTVVKAGAPAPPKPAAAGCASGAPAVPARPAAATAAAAAAECELAMEQLTVREGGGGAAWGRPGKAAAPLSSEQGGVWEAAGTEMTQSVLGAAAAGTRAPLAGRQPAASAAPPAAAGLHLETTQPSQTGAGPARQRKLSMVKETIRQTGAKRRRGPGAEREEQPATSAGAAAAAKGPRTRARARK